VSKSLVVIGAPWGDEGKGKIIDILTEKADAASDFKEGIKRATLLLLMALKLS
jgi:Adenylosuccinate synthase